MFLTSHFFRAIIRVKVSSLGKKEDDVMSSLWNTTVNFVAISLVASYLTV